MLRRVNKLLGPLFCFILLIPLPATAGGKKIPQNLSSIYGKVTDSNKNRDKLLPGVKAYLFKDTLLIDSATVKGTGDYRFDGLSEGTYDVVFRGNLYFPAKVVGTEVKRENTAGKTLLVPTVLSVYKPEDISYRLVHAQYKPQISESEIDSRITKHYGYKINAYKTGDTFTKFHHFTLRNGVKVIVCAILIPEGETATSVANILIMDPLMYNVIPPPNVGFDRGKIIEKSGAKKLK